MPEQPHGRHSRTERSVHLKLVPPPGAEVRGAERQGDRDIEVRRWRYRSTRIELIHEPVRFGRDGPLRHLPRDRVGR